MYEQLLLSRILFCTYCGWELGILLWFTVLEVDEINIPVIHLCIEFDSSGSSSGNQDRESKMSEHFVVMVHWS